MTDLHHIRKGKLTNLNDVFPFDFGYIREQGGDIHIDVYLDITVNLFDYQFTPGGGLYMLEGSLTDYTIIQATQLMISGIVYNEGKIMLRCAGYIAHTSILPATHQDDNIPPASIFYAEVEGLNLAFLNADETINKDGAILTEKDIRLTNIPLNYKKPGQTTTQTVPLTFSKNPNNNNVIIHFSYAGNDTTSTTKKLLAHEDYLEFRQPLFSLITLLNGARVSIRKECLSGLHDVGNKKLQVLITYSLGTVTPKEIVPYIPIRDYFLRDDIFTAALSNCFEKFVIENEKLDLTSIIFYLDGTGSELSLKERFFILIIAFERLARNYIQSITPVDEFIISNQDYDPVKKDLIQAIRNHSANLGGKENKFLSMIGELNRVKSTSNIFKFVKLLEYAQIPMTPEITNLIEIVRHKSIHEGEIGDDINFHILDKLLRNIILNIIGYTSHREDNYF